MVETMTEVTTDRLGSVERDTLMAVAFESIAYGLDNGCAPETKLDTYPEPLRQERASFVTLNKHGMLRGCIGHLEAFQPLVKDVADNAYAAAFRDPRFPPLKRSELSSIELHISILTPSVPLEFTSEAELLAQLRPGRDGLILKEGYNRGTFLPSVWDSLPQPEDFLRQLKRKAGLPENHWSGSVQIFRYETESFSSRPEDQPQKG